MQLGTWTLATCQPIPCPTARRRSEGDLDAVKALIGASAAINEQDELGRTAAHYAIYSSRDVLS